MKKIIKSILDEKKVKYIGKPGFPDIGYRDDGTDYSPAVKEIEKAWYYYDTTLYTWNNDYGEVIKLNTGNPLDYKSFPYAISYLKKKLNNKLYKYPSVLGDEKERSLIVDYLKKNNYPKNIDSENIIITCSTTYGFYLILKSIFREYDVVIMTAPNYGLFAFMPERLNINVEVIELSEKDNYLINPQKLDKFIKDINVKLAKKYKHLDYVPRVKAFLNINPHNPLGTVMSEKNNDLLIKLANVCKKNNIFVIDDLIYRDLCYDRDNLAKPMATIDNFFDNVISLYGLSKSYGMASTRSGFIVANNDIIRVLRNNLFYIMDSSSYLQSVLLAGTYNNYKLRNICYKYYFKKIIKKYEFNMYLVIALVEGIHSINESKYYCKVLKKIKHFDNKLLEGIPYVKVKIIPQSGYFMLIDFTKTSMYCNINSEEELLKYLYEKCGIKFLVGKSFSWPNRNEIIVRISYSLSINELLIGFSRINLAIREKLDYETNRGNSKS